MKAPDEPFILNTCMKINQLCEVLNHQENKSNAERMSKAIRKVLTEDTLNEARQKDFERKLNEDMKSNRKMTFTEMVNRYL